MSKMFRHLWFRIIFSREDSQYRQSWCTVITVYFASLVCCRKCMYLFKNGNSAAVHELLQMPSSDILYLPCHCLFDGHNSDTSFIWSLIMLWTRYKISVCRCIHIILYYHLSVDTFLRTLSTYFKDSVVISVFSTILERAVKENLLSLPPSGKIRSVGN